MTERKLNSQIRLKLLDFSIVYSVQSLKSTNNLKFITVNHKFEHNFYWENHCFYPDTEYKYNEWHINYCDQRGAKDTPMVWRPDSLRIKLQEEYMGEKVNKNYHVEYTIEPSTVGDEGNEHVFRDEHSISDVEKEFWKPDEDFIKPESDNPVRIEEFLKHLDLSPILSALEKMYVEGWQRSFTFPKEAMLKTLIYFKLKGYKFLTDLWKDMATSPTLADNLGFEEIPCYNTFYDFLIKRVGSQGIKKIFDAFVEANRIELLKYGIELGKDIGIDASPIPARKKDKEADWNGHYEMWCYSWHNLRCMDTNLPLEFHLTNGKEDEAHFLAPFIYRLEMLKNIHPDRIYIDCGYATHENFARLGIFWDIQVKSNIAKSWRIFPEATYDELKRRYSKLWKEDYYKPKPTIDDILYTLIGKGTQNLFMVGKHFRNEILTIYEECPDGYMDDYHMRNRIEGCHGSEKRNYNLNDIEANGIERVTTHLGMHLISVLAISLCRLQNGVSEGLTDTAGLI